MNDSEQKSQIMLIDYMKGIKMVDGSCLRDHVFAVGNGGTRNPREAMTMQKEGVTRSVSDLVIFYNGVLLFLEIKKLSNKTRDLRYLSGTQKSGEHIRNQAKWGQSRIKQGAIFQFAWGFAEGVNIINGLYKDFIK